MNAPLQDAADLTPLTWVQDEVRRTLEGVNKQLRRQLREFDVRQASGHLDAAQFATVMGAQAAALHQVAGVLLLVQLPEGQRLMRAAEGLLQRAAADTQFSLAHVEAIERAGFALLSYIKRLIAGNPSSPLALFPVYRVIQELGQAERIHPADFWPQQLAWKELPAPELLGEALPTLAALKEAFETALLRQMRQPGTQHAAQLAELCAGLALAFGDEPRQSFWQLAAAQFEAQALGLLAADDPQVKRMASRLLAQLRAHVQGQTEVAERLVQDLLFFCAQSGQGGALPADQAPRLRVVREVYGLDAVQTGDYRDDSLGRIDPAWVALAQRRVSAAKEAWNAAAEGEQQRAVALDEASNLLTESLAQLFPSGELLGQTLQRAAVGVLRAGARPPAALAMEVATALLYVEAALEDGAYDRPDQAGRIQRLAQRVQAAATGQPSDALESWMEEVFRRVADKQTLGSVMQELRVNLAEVERAADEYFRDPSKREQLIPVPGQLQAMRGVFTVLGLDQAAIACLRMRDEVDRLASTEVDPSLPGARVAFERLATNLGQLGFLIDMLSVQAPLAKSMFRFDAERGELVASIERERPTLPDFVVTQTPPQADVEAQLRVAAEAVANVATAPAEAAPALAHDLEVLALQAAADDRPALAEAASQAAAALSFDSLDLPDLELPDLGAPSTLPPVETTAAAAAELQALLAPEPAPAPAPAPSAPLPLSDEAYDEEMLEIFLEEANEVIASARAALDVLANDPADREQLTTVRRAFHTLKGSSRMVGLNSFGEAGWACEQLFNARLSDEKPADASLLAFSNEALDELAAWRDDIAAGQAGGRSPQGLRERADALRLPAPSAPAVPVAAPEIALELPVEPQPEPAAEPLLELPVEAPVEAPLELEVELAEPVAELVVEPAPPLPDTEDLDLVLDAPSEFASTLPPADSVLPDFAHTQPLEMDSVLPAELPSPALVDESLLQLDLDTLQTAPAPLQEPAGEPVSEELIEIDLGLPTPPAPLPAELLPELSLDLGAEEPELRLNEPVPPMPAPLPEPELVFDEPAALPSEPVAEPAAEAEVEALLAEAPAEIEIGPLRVSESLYRIFNAEAAEHGQRLVAALGDWAALADEPPPPSASVYAHALAGNAATVGHDNLSQLARAIEHALDRASQASRIAPQDAVAFLQAAEQLNGLLQAFAAGRLETADPELIERLRAYQPEMVEEAASDTAAAPLVDAVPEPQPQPAAPAALDDEADFPLGEADAIDAELWEIFEEEAGELLHELHARLRDWTSHAQDASRGDACMRTLHTFKGGARLAGAMQLGELAHRLESDVLALLARPDRGSVDVLPLQDRGDELEHRFEALRAAQRGAPAAAAVLAPTPVEAPAPAPLEAVAALPEEVVAPPEPPLAEQPILVPAPAAQPTREPSTVDWGRFAGQAARELSAAEVAPLVSGQSLVRVRAALLDRLASQSGEVSIRRARMENELTQMKTALTELDTNLERLRGQLRELEVQAELQISSRQEAAKATGADFDPLEFDRYTRFQEVTRMLAESVNDVATVQRGLQRNVQAGEDELVAQARLTRELQDDLLSSRMVEFDSVAERLHRVVRQAGRESGKQVQLEIQGHGIELDRGVLERLIGAFEHLLRNSVVHGIETPEVRQAAGKPAMGTIRVTLTQEGNQVLIAFVDDGAGLNLARIREKAIAQGLLQADQQLSDAELMQLIYAPGFSTAATVTEMAGRGVGMDVVRAEVNTLGGYVLTRSQAGKGAEFDLRVPLTTALTQVVLLRCGELQVAVPANLIDQVLRLPNAELVAGYEGNRLKTGKYDMPLFWLGGLLAHSDHPQLHGKHAAVVVVHSGPDRIAIHVDEVVGNQEVVVKNLGPQLMHVPGLAGISLLASGAVALIYNPVALAERFGAQALARAHAGGVEVVAAPEAVVEEAPLILVVDDSLTVRRVSQRFLEREGYRVMLAKDGLDAMEQLARDELPDMVLSDIEMPRMDGFDLVRNIRADQRLRTLPVVMITSRIAEKHREYAEALGVQGYLGKPYDEDQLLRLIRQHVGTAVSS